MKTVVISGGTDGLGFEIARTLTRTFNVVILSPTQKKLITAADFLKCQYELCDISKPSSIQHAISEVIKKNTSVYCLVNNAAIWIQGELEANKPDYIKRVVEVNLTGTLLLTRSVIPKMKEQKDGRIINIVSQAGLYAKTERSVYNATKWGLNGVTKSLQIELAPYGIGVTGIYPGKLKTGMFEKVGVKKEMSDALDPLYVAKTIAYILKAPSHILFPEVGIKHLKY